MSFDIALFIFTFASLDCKMCSLMYVDLLANIFKNFNLVKIPSEDKKSKPESRNVNNTTKPLSNLSFFIIFFNPFCIFIALFSKR